MTFCLMTKVMTAYERIFYGPWSTFIHQKILCAPPVTWLQSGCLVSCSQLPSALQSCDHHLPSSLTASPKTSMWRPAGNIASCCFLTRGFPFISGGWLRSLRAEGSWTPSVGWKNDPQVPKFWPPFQHTTKSSFFCTQRKLNSFVRQFSQPAPKHERKPKSKQRMGRHCSKLRSSWCLR